MSIPYVAGPAFTYVGVGTNGAPLYFGTTESEPEIVIQPEFEPVMNDLRGSRKPYTYQSMGEDAVVLGTFNKYNEGVLRLMQSRPFRAGAATNVRGNQPFGSQGALMAEEGCLFPMWMVFPYVSKAFFASNGMPAGYRFFGAFLFGPDRMPIGTRVRKVQCVFQCQAIFSLPGNWTVYDHNTSAVASIPPN
jgi:hypothetical protein